MRSIYMGVGIFLFWIKKSYKIRDSGDTNGIVSWTDCTEMQADQAVRCSPNAVIRDTKGIVSWVIGSLFTVLHNKQKKKATKRKASKQFKKEIPK